ncbi:uncharacterized protein LOC121839619 isoform X1 [Oncorhynchus tshawytscha]|uniref:uncharacterized protein LOC121839619 isoform X1 n=1 Tax=Oncorhynchus tshawytscha TaxID=74940 RepID=UPI001C3E19EE|nr:uncharacterized protein LOC121839619 isoform X1 [Oncorhynchus tshawytscha]
MGIHAKQTERQHHLCSFGAVQPHQEHLGWLTTARKRSSLPNPRQLYPGWAPQWTPPCFGQISPQGGAVSQCQCRPHIPRAQLCQMTTTSSASGKRCCLERHTHELKLLLVRVGGWEQVKLVSVDKVVVFYRYTTPDRNNPSYTVLRGDQEGELPGPAACQDGVGFGQR